MNQNVAFDRLDLNDDALRRAMRQSRSGLIAVALASAVINMLYLTSSLFMLQVYDRVIPSQSIPTLVALSLLALCLYLFQGAFEIVRSRMLTRISGLFDEAAGTLVFEAAVKAPVRAGSGNGGLLLMRDFDRVKAFLSSTGLPAFFDLPWLPFYIAICFLFHPLIGIVAIAGAIVLIVLTYLTHVSAQRSANELSKVARERDALLAAAHRNAGVVEAMGMGHDLAASWSQLNSRYRHIHRKGADGANVYATSSKIFRIALQSAVLALGAVLVINNQASGGIIIAASILLSRSLAPAEQAIANWQGFVLSLQSWRRLRPALLDGAKRTAPLALPRPEKTFSVNALFSGPPDQSCAIIANVSFTLKSGDAVAVIGPSASGKSSLARALTGIWPIRSGSVRLDNAALDQWSDTDRGNHIGYLPQEIELFDGTVAQNIARFRTDAHACSIIEAATTAGVHDMILKLTNGYETEIGPGGSALSAGQRQRIALARALFGNPFLIVLDEPNSNLDADGEVALSDAIRRIRERGAIVVVIAHRASALNSVDLVLMMMDGRVAAFGPKTEIMPKISRRSPPRDISRLSPLKVASEAGQ